MTRASQQSNALILAATCAVAVGAYVAFSTRNLEKEGKDDDVDSVTVCSSEEAIEKAKNDSLPGVTPTTTPSLPAEVYRSKKERKVWNSPGRSIPKDESTKTDAFLAIPSSPVSSRGDEASDDDFSLDDALPPFDASMSADINFSGEIALPSKHCGSNKRKAGMAGACVLLFVALIGYCSNSGFATAPSMELANIVHHKENLLNSVAVRGVTDVATTLSSFVHNSTGVPFLFHGKEEEEEKVVAWQGALNGCYGPFVGI